MGADALARLRPSEDAVLVPLASLLKLPAFVRGEAFASHDLKFVTRPRR